jgi:peptide deformylase
MALRFIRTEEDEILYKKSKYVNEITDKITELFDDMEETMKHYNGIGLAAVQVGVLKRMIVVCYEENTYRLVNPEITDSDGEETAYEGCLSVPGKHMSVKRPANVTLKAMNEEGAEVTIQASGHLARIFCHETDHLDGTLYTQIADYDQPVLYDDDEENGENEEEQI